MSFMQVIQQELALLFSNQRISRLRVFAYNGFMQSVIVFLAIAFKWTGLRPHLHASENVTMLVGYAVIALLFACSLWLGCRRLHDCNKSCKGYLSMVVAVLALFVLLSNVLHMHHNLLIKLAIILLALSQMVALIMMGYYKFMISFAPGTPGRNDYGKAPPKNNFFTTTFFLVNIILAIALVVGSFVKAEREVYQDVDFKPQKIHYDGNDFATKTRLA